MNLKNVKAKIFTQDSDCHWYLIPEDEFNTFELANENQDYDLINNEFWKYTCGHPKWIPVYTKDEVDAYKKKLLELLDTYELGVDIDIDTLEILY
jgi:hypothetical protein